MLPSDKAVEAEQRVQAEIKAAFEQERRAEAVAAERENFEAERRVRAQRDAMERNRAALAAREQAHTLAEHQNRARASQAEQPTQAEMNAALAERNRVARLAAAREDMQRIAREQERVRAQWEANERNRAALPAAHAQARDNPQDAPVVTANANRAAATSAERENTKGISEVDQRANAQKDAIERNRAILEARAQARTTSRKPPISTADVRNAAATSAESENIGRVSEAEQHVRAQRDAMEPVSYTHLTLPTIYSV